MGPRTDLRRELAALAAGAASAESTAPGGRRFWRSLEELSETPEFRRLVERQFPGQAGMAFDPVTRRKFLTLMGASLALAGVGGCSVKPAPVSEIVPYVRAPADEVPGKPLFYATAMTFAGAGVGLLVETHQGRPTKIEGNPQHPASRGATSPQHQAAVLGLYDPDRSQSVRYLGQARTWSDAAAAIRQMIDGQREKQGAGLRVLTESVVSPTLEAQLGRLLEKFRKATVHVYEPVNNDAAYQAADSAFGQVVVPRYDFTKAERVVSLDADFLGRGPAYLRDAADFMKRRRAPIDGEVAGSRKSNRLYVIETAVTCTGAKADHRLAVRARQIEQLARALAAAVGVEGAVGDSKSALSPEHQKWIASAADDLKSHVGSSLVLAGERQPAAVHLVAHAMNDRLKSTGSTLEYVSPVEWRPTSHSKSLADLTDALNRGEVECLIVLGGNPVLTAPADLAFAAALDKCPLRIHLGLYEDETSRLCHWHLPEAHFLEAWSDTRAFDGTASIVQPVIEPLHGGRSAHEVLALVIDGRELPGRAIVRGTWRSRWKLENDDAEFETRWQTAVHDGVVPDTRSSVKNVQLAANWSEHLANQSDSGDSAASRGYGPELELSFLPDPSLYDGRFANNGWLQELPKPITKITWGNAAIMSPAAAERLGLGKGSYAHGGEHGGYHMPAVELKIGERSVTAPLWLMPGHADDTVTVYLGNGRQFAGRIGSSREDPVGFNAYPLRTSREPWFAGGLQIAATGDTQLVACTQGHHSMDGRDPVRMVPVESVETEPAASRIEKQSEPLTLYEPFDSSPPRHKWGMSIDLTSCIGCNACVVACQAENNIPVVGKDQVSRGREMHWIRVDRYMEGPAGQPEAFHFQPLPCMHCEQAPCEYVCPVEATVHSADGLNEMVYNRCVGTRFCSNNCPYKVRRFNFLFYADYEGAERRMQYNPEVTVRSRGVMEKCTYCVQRIRQAEIGAEAEKRPLTDGDVLTACQAACPTRAIVFGDINDPKAEVKRLKESPLNYALLEELNTVPRTTYLTELRNPNSKLA